jgi:hypothetical protein
MKSLLIALSILFCSSAAFAQLENKPVQPKKDWSKVDLSKRASDHLLIQFGYMNWANAPDSINIGGFHRQFNMYFFFDFPFKTNPKISVALGVGVGSDNMFFQKTTIDLNQASGIIFKPDSITQYKRYRLATAYAEIPLEIRYSTNPENMNKGLKLAVGAKVGLNFNSHTRARVDLDATGVGGYVAQIKNKSAFNNTRIVGTFRAGYGNFSVYGTYGLTGIFNEGRGPIVKPWSIGLTLSGL